MLLYNKNGVRQNNGKIVEFCLAPFFLGTFIMGVLIWCNKVLFWNGFMFKREEEIMYPSKGK